MFENEGKMLPILTMRNPGFLAKSAENMVATGHILAVHLQTFFYTFNVRK